MVIEIYKITNTVNGKIYIGQTRCSLEKRWASHVSHSKKPNVRFAFAIRKHGEENFLREVIDLAYSQDVGDRLEKRYILYFKSYLPEFGYNSTFGGEHFTVTNEIKKKIASTLTGKTLSQETKDKISFFHSGVPLSLEHREKIAQTLTGRRKTHCFRGHEYNSENTYYSPSGNRACRACQKIHAEERAQKRKTLRESAPAKKPYVPTEETRKKISEANTGWSLSPEHRAAISKGKLGKFHAKLKTHCKRGHPLEGDNIHIVGRKRTCRACVKIHNQNRKFLRGN